MQNSCTRYRSVFFAQGGLTKDFKCFIYDVHDKVENIVEGMAGLNQTCSILSRLACSNWLPPTVMLAVLLGFYHYIYATSPMVPGNDSYHLGWWGWADQ